MGQESPAVYTVYRQVRCDAVSEHLQIVGTVGWWVGRQYTRSQRTYTELRVWTPKWNLNEFAYYVQMFSCQMAPELLIQAHRLTMMSVSGWGDAEDFNVSDILIYIGWPCRVCVTDLQVYAWPRSIYRVELAIDIAIIQLSCGSFFAQFITYILHHLHTCSSNS